MQPPDPLALEMLEAARAQADAARDAVIATWAGVGANLLVVLVAIGLPAIERFERRAERRRRQRQSEADVQRASQTFIEELVAFRTWLLSLPVAAIPLPEAQRWEDSLDRRDNALADARAFVEDSDLMASLEHLRQIAARAIETTKRIPVETLTRGTLIEEVGGFIKEAEAIRKPMLARLRVLPRDGRSAR